jgi:hypothetical protein
MIGTALPALPEVAVETVDWLPDRLEGAVPVGPYSQARPGALLRRVPGLGRILASGGDRVQVWLETPAGEAEMVGLLTGPITAALVHQRGELPLHAASLVAPGGSGAIALVGDKGAGKSTLAFALLRRGWSLLNDDLTRLNLGHDVVTAWPGRPGIRLCGDACARFGLDVDAMARVAGEQNKFLAPAAVIERPVPLLAVIAIDRTGDSGEAAVAGAEAAALVSRNTYRQSYVNALGVAAAHFAMVGRIVAGCRVFRLALAAPPDALAERVERMISGLPCRDAAL